MLASKLIEELNIKIEKYGDAEVNINISLGRTEYEQKEVISIFHKGEDGVYINI